MNAPGQRKRTWVECAVCEKPIPRTLSSMKRGSDFACSKKCRYILVSGKLKERISQPKKLALRRDGARCVVCGFDILVEVHHIVPRKRGGRGGQDVLENLITLCPNHHTMADRGMLNEQDLLRHLEEKTR